MFKVKRQIQQENIFLKIVATVIRALFSGWFIRGAAHKKPSALFNILFSLFLLLVALIIPLFSS